MATLEQIGMALKKAAAAGDTKSASVLAKAYRQMQAQGGATPQDSGPGGAPGSREYADWAAKQAMAGKQLPQISPSPPVDTGGLSPASAAIPATMQGITGAIPGLNQAADALLAGGQSIGDMATGQPVDFGAHYNAIQKRREQIADAAPIAQTLGGLGGTVGLTGGLGLLPGGMEAMGLSGSFGKQLLNSTGSTALYEGLQGLTHGHTGGQLLADEAGGAGSGLGGSLLGQGIGKLGEGISNAITSRAQNALTSKAIEKAPTAPQLFDAASKLFDASTGGTPLQLTDSAYMRLLSDVQNATQKYRPNENTSKEGVGLLQKLWQVADELNAPGSSVAVDFKDLHILRQTAQQVTQAAQASAESKTIAGLIIRKLDGFIDTLKLSDTAGATDPKQAANAFLTAISTWRKASKVSLIDDAIKKADTYKSGYENGLKLSFLDLMKTPDFQRFTPIEQEAIRTVAKGTTGQNIAEAFGKLGISFSGPAAHNVLGGTGATMGLGTALSPVLGPLAFPAALGVTTATGIAGRAVAENIAKKGANRAAQIMATSSIPVARRMPNVLSKFAVPANIAVRGLLGAK